MRYLGTYIRHINHLDSHYLIRGGRRDIDGGQIDSLLTCATRLASIALYSFGLLGLSTWEHYSLCQ